MQKESLDGVEAARARLDEVRARQAEQAQRQGEPAADGLGARNNDAHAPDVEQRSGLNGWTLDGDAIRKQYTFKDFPEAIAFVNRLAPEAERADHHPDILINYKRRHAHATRRTAKAA